MFYRLRQKWARSGFDRVARGILSTPPVQCAPEGEFRLVTQLQHVDVLMALCSIKSFARFLPPARITILDDGSLTDADRAVLREHLVPVEFVGISDVELPPGCPSKGTWERLVYCIRSSRDHYVIQVDADTLFPSNPEEIVDFVRSNRSFTSGTGMGQHLRSLRTAAEEIRVHPGTDYGHVQNASESAFDRLENCDERQYVRGCSGFAGYARGAIHLEDASRFSTEMSDLVGAAKWREWGSEQVTSSYLVANAPDAVVLPLDRYGVHAPNNDLRDAAFVHFLGTHRFRHGTYATMVTDLICALGES